MRTIAATAAIPIVTSIVAPSPLAAQSLRTQQFSFTGAAQSFAVPSGVTVLSVDVQGAAGGGSVSGQPDGWGGRVQANLPVMPGETLTVMVGGSTASLSGGFNGGGNGGRAFGGIGGGGGGGGGSDIRRGVLRLIVAGGGGGRSGPGYSVLGGAGGGLIGGAAAAALSAGAAVRRRLGARAVHQEARPVLPESVATAVALRRSTAH